MAVLRCTYLLISKQPFKKSLLATCSKFNSKLGQSTSYPGCPFSYKLIFFASFLMYISETPHNMLHWGPEMMAQKPLLQTLNVIESVQIFLVDYITVVECTGLWCAARVQIIPIISRDLHSKQGISIPMLLLCLSGLMHIYTVLQRCIQSLFWLP